jgi:hypothetical protein
MHPTYPTKVLRLSRKVNECKPLVLGIRSPFVAVAAGAYTRPLLSST